MILQVQESLVNLTQPNDYNNTLAQGMWSTNQFPLLTGVSLLSVHPQYNAPPAPPGPTTFLPSSGMCPSAKLQFLTFKMLACARMFPLDLWIGIMPASNLCIEKTPS